MSGWLKPTWTTYNLGATVPLTAQAIKAIGGSAGIALELTAGGTYLIVKYDSGAGPIKLTYLGASVYELTTQLQFVLLSWDGAEFMEMSANYFDLTEQTHENIFSVCNALAVSCRRPAIGQCSGSAGGRAGHRRALWPRASRWRQAEQHFCCDRVYALDRLPMSDQPSLHRSRELDADQAAALAAAAPPTIRWRSPTPLPLL